MQITDTMREFDDDGRQELVITLTASPEDIDEASKRFFADIHQKTLSKHAMRSRFSPSKICKFARG